MNTFELNPARRRFLQAGVAAAAVAANGRLFGAPRYDLLIRGGRVIDASQKLDKIIDVAISGGKIAELKAGIPAADAAKVIDATGRIVSPGLIDVHTHLIDPGMSAAMALSDGVTTVVDGGSVGADNIDNLKKLIANPPNRVRVLLNIGRTGNSADGEMKDIKSADPVACQRVIEANRDLITGVKVRVGKDISGGNDLEAIKRAVQAASAVKLPVVVHVGDSISTMPQMLALLRPGDVVTHMYAPTPNGIFDANNKILPEVRDARKKGIQFDIGHGRLMHITWETAQRAIEQDFLPDTISTDLNQITRKQQVFSLPITLGKFLLLGMSLNQVLTCVTLNAGKSLPALSGLGTLKKGAIADVTVLQVQQGDFDFVDNLQVKKTGHQNLIATATVVAGKQV
jgi:dihydroorotase